MSLTLYRVRSRRDAIAQGGDEDALLRESYGCLERPDCTLFLWRDADGEPRMLQFLFGERFLEWFDDRAWIAGDTNRFARPVGAPGHGKGVRTLHGHRAGAGDAVLEEGLGLLRAATLPPELAAVLSELLSASAEGRDAREH